MFGIGSGELLLLLVLALLVLGPERMPRLARDIGRTVGDLRRTSDELRQEFLNADALLDKVAAGSEPAKDPPAELGAGSLPAGTPAAVAVASAEPVAGGSGAGLTQAAVGSPEAEASAEPEPDETAFDREARLARERLDDPARAERAKAEGWTAPTDEAGANSDKWS